MGNERLTPQRISVHGPNRYTVEFHQAQHGTCTFEFMVVTSGRQRIVSPDQAFVDLMKAMESDATAKLLLRNLLAVLRRFHRVREGFVNRNAALDEGRLK